MGTESEAFTGWLDRFFAAYHARRPVSATFIGVHAHDHLLPDLSEAGDASAASEMRALLHACADFEESRLEPSEALDLRLARGFLRIQLAELASDHFQRGNPATHTGEAVFGVMALFLSHFAPLPERVEAATSRLRQVPDLLATARQRIRAAPTAWTGRALDDCRGAQAFLNEGVPILCENRGIVDPAFRAAAADAARAVALHRAHLETTLLQRPLEEHGCGEGMLRLYLREGHFVDEAPDDIAARAEAGVREARERLEDGAARLGATSPEQALAPVREPPAPERVGVERYRVAWEACRRVTLQKELLTWPEFPIRFIPQPRWASAAAPHLYFLPYRSPAAFGRPPVHDHLADPTAPDAVVKLNHVIHHAGIGHHVQNWHAFRAPSRVGRIAAVDGASRIAMFCGGTMAEGWACYATDLMDEIGFLTPVQSLAETASRARMCARAVVDVRLHQGRWSLEEAASYYVRNAGLDHAAARREAVKNSMFPGAAVMYMLGTDAIHRLRRDLSERLGSAFDLRRFHDAFLAHGSVPVSLVADAMRSEADAL